MKLQNLTAEDVCKGIRKTAVDLAIMDHEEGYNHIAIELDGDIVVGYSLDYLPDDYFRAEGWHKLLTLGTGSVSCNCEACLAGEDPEEWIDGEQGYYIIDRLQDAINDLRRDLVN